MTDHGATDHGATDREATERGDHMEGHMEIGELLDQLEQLIADARPVPLSASVMVNRKEVEEVLAEIREALPEELRQARWVLKERDEVLGAARREAAQIHEDSLEEQHRLISDTEVVRVSQREAERIVEDAREQARVLRLESEDYADSKLANFEIILNKTLTTVEKGRERLRGRLVSDDLSPAELGDEPPENGYGPDDPATQFYDHENLEPR